MPLSRPGSSWIRSILAIDCISSLASVVITPCYCPTCTNEDILINIDSLLICKELSSSYQYYWHFSMRPNFCIFIYWLDDFSYHPNVPPLIDPVSYLPAKSYWFSAWPTSVLYHPFNCPSGTVCWYMQIVESNSFLHSPARKSIFEAEVTPKMAITAINLE